MDAVVDSGAGIGTDDRSGGKYASLKIPPESAAITTPIVNANIFGRGFFFCLFF
jgi:hypothetical protein